MVVKALIDHPVADWVYRRANEQLSGRALSCAVNARNHLVRAQKIADAEISSTIAYFCATHATEEAVAAFIASAKMHGYRKLAGKVNIHDHAQKAVVSAYAQIISGHAEELKLVVAHNPAADDVLARIRIGGEETVYPLRLRLFSFNEDGEDPSSEAAFDAFRSWFPDRAAMVERVRERASFRDKALYAGDDGGPALSRQQLDDGLREHTLLTLGLIWAAMDVTSHKEPEPFVVQVLGAISTVIDQVRPSKVCKHCGK
ncbi:hypothetical protein [Mesorhizobium sp. B1-1-6]|uniref:hypothetical protein n=1 Tax=Mesorhizobium sp. B1-1-6 TaxID=2589978 RepID=UPI00112A322F|nr:hypothetical protein [Mesorhizobium sp. B1-1-6]TPN33196.1 hypothetical protein FJ979_25020 [Mesorhizobium sp. B1-1-6]